MKIQQTRIGLLALCLLVATSGAAQATDLYLVARAFDKVLPDGAIVRMWGYAEDADGNLATDDGEIPSSPGPRLTVPPGDTVLNIHLRNELTADTSIVIPGQPASLTPVRMTDTAGRSRATSFTAVAAAGGGTATYSWTAIRPGTYLYHSGTHPALQVQMGLYGPATIDSATSTVYPGLLYNSEVVVFLSEIDSGLHDAVATGTYGLPPHTSAFEYHPDYFLVNGEPFSAGDAPMAAGSPGETVLIRFLNAGLRTHVPTLLGPDLSIVAEDGNLYPFPRIRYTADLPAGKTLDALWRPTSATMYRMFDRTMHLTSAGVTGGGILVNLAVGAAPATLCGDVTGDGSISIVDALVVAQFQVGLRTCEELPQPEACDVTPVPNDGACGIGDALRMAQCDVGLIPCDFICTPPFTCPAP